MAPSRAARLPASLVPAAGGGGAKVDLGGWAREPLEVGEPPGGLGADLACFLAMRRHADCDELQISRKYGPTVVSSSRFGHRSPRTG